MQKAGRRIRLATPSFALLAVAVLCLDLGGPRASFAQVSSERWWLATRATSRPTEIQFAHWSDAAEPSPLALDAIQLVADRFGINAAPRAAYGLPGGNDSRLEPFVAPDEPALFPAPDGWSREFPFVDFSRDHPDDPGRHVGRGDPLEGTSWRNRPWHIGWFYGLLNGDDLIDRRVDQHTGQFGGYRLGYDVAHYWGVEGRFAFANLEVADTGAVQNNRTSRDWYTDIDLLYYPWGDSAWRPFFSWGLGWGSFRFVDERNRPVKDTTVSMPFGVGVKYYFRNWLALRVDALDNFAFSSQTVDSMHNLSLTFGIELHLGGTRRSYFPWHPGIQPF
jgi:hypothetical protein